MNGFLYEQTVISNDTHFTVRGYPYPKYLTIEIAEHESLRILLKWCTELFEYIPIYKIDDFHLLNIANMLDRDKTWSSNWKHVIYMEIRYRKRLGIWTLGG